MPTCYADDVVKIAHSYLGTKEGSNNWNEFAKELDSVNYFRPQKKQNLPWCCTYVDDIIYKASNKDKSKAYYVLYQPSYDNLSAVVKYLAGYFKSNGAYFTDKNKVEIGDVIFFNQLDSKGKVTSKYSHTGLIIAVTSSGVKTSEGNKNNQVSECNYSFSQIGTKIEGFGKPRYDKKPSPTPPTPTDDYTVRTKTGDSLRLRAEATTKSAELCKIPNNTVISAWDVVNGESIGGCTAWVKTTYSGKTGYCSGYYLTPRPEVKPEPTPPQPTTKTYRVKTNSGVALRIRQKPTVASKQVGYIPNGKTVQVDSISGGWAHIPNYNNVSGYAYAKYLKEV